VRTDELARFHAKRLRDVFAVPEAECRAYVAEGREMGAITIAGLLAFGVC
jgi:hypothetical protein